MLQPVEYSALMERLAVAQQLALDLQAALAARTPSGEVAGAVVVEPVGYS